jgi:Rps23 Pro-64 3,4-dihydroxylase Tpa1-like proline 4-hydroxylase
MMEAEKSSLHHLPLIFLDGPQMNAREAAQAGKSHSQQYQSAHPFPHAVIDNFLPTNFLDELLNHFPKDPTASDRHYENKHGGFHKRQVLPYDGDRFVREAFHFFSSSAFLAYLESLTGIEALIPDPYFFGGGFHEISTGGSLQVHADFRIHKKLNLQRRINVLVYLNKDWNPAFGGNLELWDRQMKNRIKAVEPFFNRCVIFNTDADSYHGHPEALRCPPDRTRKSLALYYYTASKEIYREVPTYSTMYQTRPNASLLTHAQTLKSRGLNYLKDWIPPALLRYLAKAGS